MQTQELSPLVPLRPLSYSVTLASALPMNLIIAASICAILSLGCFALSVSAIRKKRLLGMTANATLALLFLALGALFAVITVSTRGYQALTREDLVARVHTRPMGPQSFVARVEFVDDGEQTYVLAGDEFYIDAHILKWKPIANLLGLHTQYELDRISGRYIDVQDERNQPRTLFSLKAEKSLDMFTMRRRWSVLSPLVDAEYGSATFVAVNAPAEFEVRVSTSGLLIRGVPIGTTR
jgi:hypothetical protein